MYEMSSALAIENVRTRKMAQMGIEIPFAIPEICTCQLEIAVVISEMNVAVLLLIAKLHHTRPPYVLTHPCTFNWSHICPYPSNHKFIHPSCTVYHTYTSNYPQFHPPHLHSLHHTDTHNSTHHSSTLSTTQIHVIPPTIPAFTVPHIHR